MKQLLVAILTAFIVISSVQSVEARGRKGSHRVGAGFLSRPRQNPSTPRSGPRKSHRGCGRPMKRVDLIRHLNSHHCELDRRVALILEPVGEKRLGGHGRSVLTSLRLASLAQV